MRELNRNYHGLCHGGFTRKKLPKHSFTIVVNEASTPPTSTLAWSTELPPPTLKHVNRQE